MQSEPSDAEVKEAIRDWRSMNTGWEAAQNAKARKLNAETKEQPLVHLGGRNYARVGSTIAASIGTSKGGGE